MAETIPGMVVDQSRGLHMGIKNRSAQKFESSFFQIFGPSLRFRSHHGNIFHGFNPMDHRFMPHPGPHVLGKGSEFFLDFLKEPGVLNGGFDLEPVADDAGVPHQSGPVPGVETRDLHVVKALEGLSKVFPLVENGPPGKPGLEGLQY